MVVNKVKCLYMVQQGGRYKVEVDQLSAGNLVLIAGIDQSVSKTATVYDVQEE